MAFFAIALSTLATWQERGVFLLGCTEVFDARPSRGVGKGVGIDSLQLIEVIIIDNLIYDLLDHFL